MLQSRLSQEDLFLDPLVNSTHNNNNNNNDVSVHKRESTGRISLPPPPTYEAYGLHEEEGGAGHHNHHHEDADHEEVLSSAMDQIDLNHIHQSLSYVSHFKRRNEKLPAILMYEINDLGESVYVTMTLRELLNYVNQEAYEIDEAFVKKLQEMSLQQKLTLAKNTKNTGSSSNLAGLDHVSSTTGSSHVDGTRSHRELGNIPWPSQTQTTSRPAPLSSSNSSNNLAMMNTAVPGVRDHTSAGYATHSSLPGHGSHQGNEHNKSYDSVRELRLRDLRRLDFQFNPNEEKLILIRRHAVLFAMDPIRAVVMARRLILIVPDGADTLLSILDEHMREWVNEEKAHRLESKQKQEQQQQQQDQPQLLVDSAHLAAPTPLSPITEETVTKSNASTTNRQRYEHNTPFEFHAYEALLTTVKALETQEFMKLQSSVNETLSYFKSGSLLLPVKVQEAMRASKNDLSSMMTRVSASRKALQELTEDDEEMALMNLTVLQEDPSLYRFPLVPEILGRHDEIEELTESYLFDFNTLESKIALLKSNIQSAEELVSLRLDTSRNDLLIATTALEVLACSIAFGAYITGAFGMNLDNTLTIQDRKYSFMVVTVASFVCIVVAFILALTYLQRNGILPTRTALHKLNASNRPAASSKSSRRGAFFYPTKYFPHRKSNTDLSHESQPTIALNSKKNKRG